MKACAIVAASEFDAERFAELADAGAFDCAVAVDGGYAHLQKIGYMPDLAIGDFDSLGYVPQGMPVRRFSAEKDESDLELALRWAAGEGFSHIYAFGVLGKRLDHTIANLQLFAKCSEEGISVKAEGAETELVFLSGPETLSLPAREAGTVSVFSMSDECTGVFEVGLKWELDNIELTNRTSLGLSNEFIGLPVKISVRTGTLMVFLPL